jgi:hypothetical protein
MDGMGGPDAFACGSAQAGDTVIEIAASVLVKLENEYMIEGTRGSIRGATADYSRFQHKEAGGGWKTVTAGDAADRVEIARRMLTNFVAAVDGTAQPLIEAASAIRPLRVIDAMYDQAVGIVPDCYREWMPDAAAAGAALQAAQ